MRRTLILALLLAAPLTRGQPPHKSPDTLRAEAKALLATETAHAKKGICQNPNFKQMDLNICFGGEAHRIDASYTKYVHILGALLRAEAAEDRSADAPPSTPPQLFDAAEAAWQDYRTKTCKATASLYEGGSMQPMRFSGCYAAVTFTHMKEIASFAGEL